MQTEMVVSIALLAMVGMIAVRGLAAYRQVGREHQYRNIARQAVLSQWERYQAGMPIDTPVPPGMLADRIALSTRVEPADGDWNGFDLIVITATITPRNGRPIVERLRGYLPHRDVKQSRGGAEHGCGDSIAPTNIVYLRSRL